MLWCTDALGSRALVGGDLSTALVLWCTGGQSPLHQPALVESHVHSLAVVESQAKPCPQSCNHPPRIGCFKLASSCHSTMAGAIAVEGRGGASANGVGSGALVGPDGFW